MTEALPQVEDVLALSPLQEGLFALYRLAEDSVDLYTMQFEFDIDGPVDVELLHRSAQAMLERHPNLRVLFLEAGCGWVPYWLERIEHHLVGPDAYVDVPLPLRADEYFRRQCYVAADSDEMWGVTS